MVWVLVTPGWLDRDNGGIDNMNAMAKYIANAIKGDTIIVKPRGYYPMLADEVRMEIELSRIINWELTTPTGLRMMDDHFKYIIIPEFEGMVRSFPDWVMSTNRQSVIGIVNDIGDLPEFVIGRFHHITLGTGGLEEKSVCWYCSETIYEGGPVRVLDYGHIIHDSCIEKIKRKLGND